MWQDVPYKHEATQAQPVLRRIVDIWMCAQELSRCLDCALRSLCCRCIDLQPFSTNSDDDLHGGMITAEGVKPPQFSDEDKGRGEPLSARLNTSIDLADVEGDPDLEERQRRALEFRRTLSLHRAFGDARAKESVITVLNQPSSSRAAVRKSRPSVRASKVNKTDFPTVHFSTKPQDKHDCKINSSRNLDKQKSSEVDKRDSGRKVSKLRSEKTIDQIHVSNNYHSQEDSIKGLKVGECTASTTKGTRLISAARAEKFDSSQVKLSPELQLRDSAVISHRASPKKNEKSKDLQHCPRKEKCTEGSRSPEFPVLVERSEIRRKYYASRDKDEDELVRDHGMDFVYS